LQAATCGLHANLLLLNINSLTTAGGPSMFCGFVLTIRPFFLCLPAGLLPLKQVIVGGPINVVQAMHATWNATLSTPCHSIDPNCQPCTTLELCGTPVAGAVAPPSFYCSAWGISCRNGRVAGIALNQSGLVLGQLPPQLNQLAWLQTLGEFGPSVQDYSGAV
jgi:hypothetical protein